MLAGSHESLGGVSDELLRLGWGLAFEASFDFGEFFFEGGHDSF